MTRVASRIAGQVAGRLRAGLATAAPAARAIAARLRRPASGRPAVWALLEGGDPISPAFLGATREWAPGGPAAFLFDGGDLVDASPAARRLLAGRGPRFATLVGVASLLRGRFGDDLARRLAALPSPGRLDLAARAGGGRLRAEAGNGMLRLTLDLRGGGEDNRRGGEEGGGDGTGLDRLRLEAAEAELELLRGLVEDLPHLVWAEDGTGALAWANRAYLAAHDLAQGTPEVSGAAWPARPFLDPGPIAPASRRLAVPGPPAAAGPRWLDVVSVRRGPGVLHVAVDAGPAVAAEAARDAAQRLLAQACAQVPTAVAVWGGDRRLALHNPAFAELTGLPAAFLAGRPSFASVLDRLRDARILPEVRDYAAWRDRLTSPGPALGPTPAAQREGWTLPDGRTWRVALHAEADGSLAVVIEDASDEVALARRLRLGLDTAQAALDSLGEAVAAFAATGTLTFASAAYAELWGPPAEGLGDATLAGEAARWTARAPGPLWARLAGGRWGAADGRVRLADGREAEVRVVPLAGGGTLIRFRLDDAADGSRLDSA